MIIGTHMAGVGNASHTVLLIQSDTTDGSTTWVDSSQGGTSHTTSISRGGNTEHSTAQKRFAKTSIAVPAAADYLTLPHHSDWDFSTNCCWTVDGWVRPIDVVTANRVLILSGRYAGTYDQQWGVLLSASKLVTQVRLTGGAIRRYEGTTNVTPNVWHHFALQRRGDGSFRCYLDGQYEAGEIPNSWTFISTAYDLRLTSLEGASTYGVSGFIDEVRVTNGRVVFPWEGFTPPNRMS